MISSGSRRNQEHSSLEFCREGCMQNILFRLFVSYRVNDPLQSLETIIDWKHMVFTVCDGWKLSKANVLTLFIISCLDIWFIIHWFSCRVTWRICLPGFRWSPSLPHSTPWPRAAALYLPDVKRKHQTNTKWASVKRRIHTKSQRGNCSLWVCGAFKISDCSCA